MALILLLAPLGGCELYLLSLVSMGDLGAEEAAILEGILQSEERRAGTTFADYNEMTNSQANVNIYKDPRNFLTYSNPGFNADHLTNTTYPGLFCATGSAVPSSLQGFAFSNADIASLRSQLQSQGIANPTLTQITSVCSFGSQP